MEIQITIQNKRATAACDEVLSFNNGDELVFSFDEEWGDFPNRVAVAVYEGGSNQVAFTGNRCALPLIDREGIDFVLIGVYSVAGEKRIGSSFVRFRVAEGAHFVPESNVSESLQEQIIALLNSYDWSIFSSKVAPGLYTAVGVNGKGMVTRGGISIEIGTAGQTSPSAALIPGGLFLRLENGSYIPYVRANSGIAQLPVTAQKVEHPLTVFGKSYDGSAAQQVTKADLQLSYDDLQDKPTVVSSVNGKTGQVSITKADLGIEQVTDHRQMPLAQYVIYGADYNNYKSTGFTEIYGSADYPTSNAPTSASNPSATDGDWFLLVLARGELNYITQIAFSVRSDVAVRIRNYSFGEWTAWQTIH